MARHFCAVHDLSGDDLTDIFDRAELLAEDFGNRAMPLLLRGRRVALSFEDGGFRNRVAFELGIKEMGGEAVYIPGKPGEREPAADIAKYLSNWFDALVVRTPRIDVVREMAGASTVPVINARTRHNHPCEIVGDLAYVRHLRRSLDGLTVVFVGEPTNLCHSWFEAAGTLPISVVQVCPEGYEVKMEFISEIMRRGVGSVRVTHDFPDSLYDADVIYTDCWPQRQGADEHDRVAKKFIPYRITAKILKKTRADCLFLPCPPVTRGEEVSDDAMNADRCKVFQAKDYLLHAQNALLASLIC